MTKLYFKYNKAIQDVKDVNSRNLIEKYKGCGRDGIRIRVIVENENYESPKVQLSEYEYEFEEPWKSGYWLLGETTWDGTFIPDKTWELVELKD